MSLRRLLPLCGCLAAIAGLSLGTAAGPQPKSEVADDAPRLSLTAARDKAQLMHDVYEVTLDTIHHRYFRREQPVIPARAMEDVFADVARMHHIQARWISASFSPMGIDHGPQTDFEKLAARKLAQGEKQVEIIENGVYRRAGSIPLRGGCVTCHAGTFASMSASAKFAGLIISIPVDEHAQITDPAPPAGP